MRKNIYVMCLLLGACSIVNAAITTFSLDLSASSGVGFPDNSTPIAVGSRIDLIWSSDLTYETPIIGSIPTAPVTPGSVSSVWGSDYLLNSWTIQEDGKIADDGGVTYYDAAVGSTIQNGYFYIYIYQDGTPSVNDYYGRSDITACNDQLLNQPPPVTSLDMAPGSDPFIVGSVPNGGQGLQVQAVPEPSSLALLGIGLGLVAWRRMRK